jgi:cytochrome c oxidase cbb3-type subunit III
MRDKVRKRRSLFWPLGVVVVLALAALIGFAIHDRLMATRLLVTDPDKVPSHPELVSYAASLARPAYASNCASCHGADMKGDQAKGAPNLTDQVWLYDFGGVGDIERTILYGIRSGHAKARNITDMPALGRTMQLSPAEVSDAANFVISISRPQGIDQASVARGSKIFQGKGVCYDCHSADAAGNPDYGAPAFTDTDWIYGGDYKSVYDSIYSGRHGLCPAWIGKLKPEVIRALAVYIHQVSHPSPAAGGHAHG